MGSTRNKFHEPQTHYSVFSLVLCIPAELHVEDQRTMNIISSLWKWMWLCMSSKFSPPRFDWRPPEGTDECFQLRYFIIRMWTMGKFIACVSRGCGIFVFILFFSYYFKERQWVGPAESDFNNRLLMPANIQREQ